MKVFFFMVLSRAYLLVVMVVQNHCQYRILSSSMRVCGCSGYVTVQSLTVYFESCHHTKWKNCYNHQLVLVPDTVTYCKTSIGHILKDAKYYVQIMLMTILMFYTNGQCDDRMSVQPSVYAFGILLSERLSSGS